MFITFDCHIFYCCGIKWIVIWELTKECGCLCWPAAIFILFLFLFFCITFFVNWFLGIKGQIKQRHSSFCSHDCVYIKLFGFLINERKMWPVHDLISIISDCDLIKRIKKYKHQEESFFVGSLFLLLFALKCSLLFSPTLPSYNLSVYTGLRSYA